MIDRNDSIVSLTYGGAARQATVTLVGQPSNVAAMVAKQVEHWLEKSGGPMTLVASNPFSIINADEHVE